jgi:hypothetical protein
MNHCSAPWYELNLSAPDDNATACCYYDGDREKFAGGNASLDHYWNGPNMRALRRLQGNPSPPTPNGCSNCFFFKNKAAAAAGTYFDFNQPFPNDISDLQKENWLLARTEHAERTEHVKAVPLRLYSNFGFTCNLSCKMCHQVPRRQSIDRFITSDALYAWRDQMQRMMEVCVIGGEPFAMPESIKFIRRFVDDDGLDPVRLSIFTNGTVHHKHFENIKRKRKMGFCISLDSIAGGYENIRVGSQWKIVERNVLMVKETITKERPDWWLFTNGIIMKTGIPFLPDFAAWHVKHGIQTQFLDFVNARGTEDAFFSENIISHPHLLDDVPGWDDHFDRAIETFESAGDASSGMSLRHFRDRAVEARATKGEQSARAKVTSMKNDWWPVDERDSTPSRNGLWYYTPETAKPPAFDSTSNPPHFTQTRPGESFCGPWKSIEVGDEPSNFRLVADWQATAGEDRQAHIIVQWDEGEIEGVRDYRSLSSGTRLTMIGTVPANATRVRVVIFPVGEFKSWAPRHYSLELDSRAAPRRVEVIQQARAAVAAPISLIARAPRAIGRRAKRLLNAIR